MSEFNEELEPGTIFSWVVGMPGPDIDQGVVLECLGPGVHRVLFKCWGRGPWLEKTTTASLYPDHPYPGQVSAPVVEMLKQEWSRRSSNEEPNP